MDTNTAIERVAERGLSLEIATLTQFRGVGGMTQQNVTSRLHTMMLDHLTAGHVEAITADFTGWVCDSPKSVSKNPGTPGYTLHLCVL